MNETGTPAWAEKRTEETRSVEDLLKSVGFGQVDAYRYNSASIRLRVVDRQFDGKSLEERAGLVEKHLDMLPDRTQADIMNLLTFTPEEMSEMRWSSKGYMINSEFENPSPSRL